MQQFPTVQCFVNRKILVDNASENKALNLLDYFLDLSRLRQKSIKDIGSYKNIFWLSEIPKNEKSYCFTQAWGTLEEDDEKDSDWIRLKKCKEPLLPAIPKDCIPWVDQDALLNKKDIPSLNSSATIEQQIPNPDWDPEDPENSEEEEFIITTKDINLENYPEVSRQWDSYVENKWMPWQEQHERWEPIHKPYSSVFTIYQEEKKLGEEYELLLGVGLLSWNNIKRHLITANAEIIFDPKGGQFTVNIPHHGPQLYSRPQDKGGCSPAGLTMAGGICQAELWTPARAPLNVVQGRFWRKQDWWSVSAN